MDALNIAIVGATGAVGVEILRVLERRNFLGDHAERTHQNPSTSAWTSSFERAFLVSGRFSVSVRT